MESFLTPYSFSSSGQGKLQFTLIWGGLKPVCSDGLRAGTIESHNFFVLGPILVKFHIRTRLIESLRTIFWTWWCGEEKLHFTLVHTLRQLKHDEALIPPFRRVVEFRAGVRLGNCTQVWGWAKFEERGTHGWGKIVLHTWLTSPNLSKPVHNTVPMYTRPAMSFFALLKAFIFQSYILSCWNCIFYLA